MKSFSTLFHSFLIAAVMVVALSFTVPVQAGEPYSRNQVLAYIDQTYGQDMRVRRYRGDVVWSVAGNEDLSGDEIRAVFDAFDKLTPVSLRSGDGENVNLAIEYVNNVAFEAMTPRYRPKLQNGAADDAYIKTLSQVAEKRKNLVSIIEASDTDQSILSGFVLAEKHWAKRGTYMPPRRYLMKIVFLMLTDTKGEHLPQGSVQARAPDLAELTKLPAMDTALIHAVYTYDNWNQLTPAQAREQMARTMMSDLQKNGRGE